jgi:hypothetical protein
MSRCAQSVARRESPCGISGGHEFATAKAVIRPFSVREFCDSKSCHLVCQRAVAARIHPGASKIMTANAVIRAKGSSGQQGAVFDPAGAPV